MTIAGGIMGALFHRERTGETTEVDVSLLGVGLWSMGAALALSLQMEVPWRGMVPRTATGNPLTGNYRTKDGRFVALTCLQMGKYWPEACEVLGLPELATDERFADHASIAAHAAEATELLRTLPRADRRRVARSASASPVRWAMVQDTLEAAADHQTVANGYVQDYVDVDGNPYRLASPPVHFGGEPPEPRRAPRFNEHGDEILEGLGIDWDRIVDLKVHHLTSTSSAHSWIWGTSSGQRTNSPSVVPAMRSSCRSAHSRSPHGGSTMRAFGRASTMRSRSPSCGGCRRRRCGTRASGRSKAGLLHAHAGHHLGLAGAVHGHPATHRLDELGRVLREEALAVGRVALEHLGPLRQLDDRLHPTGPRGLERAGAVAHAERHEPEGTAADPPHRQRRRDLAVAAAASIEIENRPNRR